jgi:tRNA nucleotidyltransferase/poly(A) polymerase
MTLADEVIERVSAIMNPVYLVGGSVRDALMGRTCTDFDFSTPLTPDLIESAVRAAGRRPYLMGKRFGTVAFRLDGLTIEVTTFRSEDYVAGSRRPSVEFLPDLEHDLSRRDFTINAMARHGDELIDLFGGREDLEAGLVRAVGDPAERFAEDPLRMLRAARFVSQLDFAIDEGTQLAARQLAPAILSVARERWMIELDRLLVGPGVESSLHLLADTRLIGFLLPEVGLQSGIVLPDDLGTSLFDETVVAVGSAPGDVISRWGALLMDVAEAYLPEPGVGEVEFSGGNRRARALLSAEIVERTALYLKWSNGRREEVKRLVGLGGT